MNNYPQYEDINLPWLKSIPSHWKILKNKNVLSEMKQLVGENASEYTLLSLTLNGVIPRDVKSGKGKFPKSFDTYKVVEKDNVAFCLFDMDETPRTVGLAKADGMLTGAYDIFKIDGINPKYFTYYYTALDDIKALRYYYSGLRKTVNINTFMNILMPIPSEDEQRKIVEFLDWKTSCSTKLTLTTKREVDLLREYRDTLFQSVISESVEKIKLKHLVNLIYDSVEIKEDEVYRKAGMYNRGRGIFIREETPGDAMGDSKFQHIYRNCVMLSGQFAWEGAVYVTSEKDEIAVASHRYYLLKPSQSDITSEYIYAYLASEKGVMEMNRCSHGAAGRNKPLNIRELLNVEIPIPRDLEDVKKIDEAVRNLMLFQEDNIQKVKLIEEIRSKIVFDVVTGKIDVRDVVIPAYEKYDDLDDEIEDDSEDDSGEEE